MKHSELNWYFVICALQIYDIFPNTMLFRYLVLSIPSIYAQYKVEWRNVNIICVKWCESTDLTKFLLHKYLIGCAVKLQFPSIYVRLSKIFNFEYCNIVNLLNTHEFSLVDSLSEMWYPLERKKEIFSFISVLHSLNAFSMNAQPEIILETVVMYQLNTFKYLDSTHIIRL